MLPRNASTSAQVKSIGRPRTSTRFALRKLRPTSTTLDRRASITLRTPRSFLAVYPPSAAG